MNLKIHDYDDYVDYINEVLDSAPATRGQRAELARRLGCQASFVSQVLTRRAHFSREQGIKVAAHLGLDPEERAFFMVMLDLARSGSKELHDFHRDQLASMRRSREDIRSRLLTSRTLDEHDLATYYGSWIYIALHIATALPGAGQTKDLAARFDLPLQKVESALEWMEARGIVRRGLLRWEIGTETMHLGPHSPLVARHHLNWRMKAVERLDRPDERNLHYTSVLGISSSCREHIRSKLLALLAEVDPVVAACPEEEMVLFQFDLMKI